MEVRALKASNGDLVLEVLGAPFGGPYNGKDSQGDYFDADTNIHADKYPEIPLIYAHGFDPQTRKQSDKPVFIGRAKYSRKDSKGHWYEAVLDKTNEVAKRLWEAAQKGLVKASSGAINYLVRRAKNGKLLEWPVGELTLIDVSEGLEPANPYAIAVPMLKIDYEMAGMKLEGALGDEAQSGNSTETITTTNNKGGTMAEQNAVPTVVENELAPTVSDLQQGIQEILEQKQEQRKAAEKKQAAKANIVSTLAQYIDETMSEAMKNQPAENAAGKSYLNLKTKRGDNAYKAFAHFLVTGDAGGIRTGEAYEREMKTNYILTEGTQYQGQEVVPTEVYNAIVERRNQLSVARAGNALVIPAGSNAVNIPVEKANPEAFGITTINGSNSFTTLTQQPLDKLASTIYDFTYNVPITQNTIDDSVVQLEGWLARYIGRGLALTENTYFLMGTGSGQPQGAVYASTKGVDAASASALTAAEIVKLYYSLSSEYRDNVCWVMLGATEAALRGLTASTSFPFVGNSGFSGGVGNGGFPQGAGWLVDTKSKVFNSSAMDAIAASKKPVAVCNFEAGYAIAERKSLTVLRDPYSSASTGTVQLWFHARMTGGVTNAVAHQHILTPTG